MLLECPQHNNICHGAKTYQYYFCLGYSCSAWHYVAKFDCTCFAAAELFCISPATSKSPCFSLSYLLVEGTEKKSIQKQNFFFNLKNFIPKSKHFQKVFWFFVMETTLVFCCLATVVYWFTHVSCRNYVFHSSMEKQSWDKTSGKNYSFFIYLKIKSHLTLA